MLETLQRAFENLDREGIKINKFRSDAAAYQDEIIEYLDSRKIKFFIRASNSPNNVQKYLDPFLKWKHLKINGFDCQLTSIERMVRGKSYRIVVRKAEDREGTVKYAGIITNNWKMTEEEIIRFYNARGAIERNFDDLKNNFNWKRIPFSFLHENTVFLIVSAIAAIVYQYIIRTFSKRVDFVKSTFRLKNFIFHFITVGSSWEDSGELVLHTDKSYKVLLE